MDELELISFIKKTTPSKDSVMELKSLLEGAGGERDLNALVATLLKEGYVEGASTLVLSASLVDKPVDARCLADILPSIDDLTLLFPLLRSVSGDIDGCLLDLVEAGVQSWERDAIVIHLLAQRSEGKENPRLIVALRTLARQNLSIPASVEIGMAATLLNDDEASKAASEHIELAKIFPSKRDFFKEMIEAPLLELLPERVAPKIISGQTLRRKAAKVQRNDQCPCGSGKKYKKCCINKPATDSSKEDQVWENDLSKIMTLEQFYKLRPKEIMAMDFTTLPTVYLIAAFRRFQDYKRWAQASLALDELATREDIPFDQHVDDFRNELIYLAVDSGAMEVAKCQRDLMEQPIEEDLRLKFDLVETEGETIKRVEAFAKKALQSGDSACGSDLAYGLLKTYPALGIFVARGALSREMLFDSEMLVQEIEITRDRLLLPTGDIAQEMLDYLMKSSLDIKINKAKEYSNDKSLKEAVVEAESMRESYNAAQKHIVSLEEALKKQEDSLRKISENKKINEVGHEDRKEDKHKEEEQQQLRRKIDNLKSLISQGNEERTELRSHLSKVQDRLKNSNERIPQEKMEDVEDGERDLEENELALLRDNREKEHYIPVFTDAARKGMREAPEHVAHLALQLCARLASHQQEAWHGVKLLKRVSNIYSARLGIHHRLLFSIAKDVHDLQILKVIHRRDLRRAIKSFE